MAFSLYQVCIALFHPFLFDQYKVFETTDHLFLEIIFSLASLQSVFLDLCPSLSFLFIKYSIL